MAHVVDETPPVKSRLGLLWGVAAVALVLLLLIEAFSFASKGGSGTSATTQVLNVGPKDEAEVKIPLMQLVAFAPDKNIIIRRPDNEFFLKTPTGELYQYNKKTGKYDEGVSAFGYNVPKVYIRSAGGIARVEISFARGDFKPAAPTPPAPTPPTATVPVPPATKPPPSTGATPLPPAKPLSPKGGMV
ncbi:MAG: hypothetical protein A3B13_01170 [Candidatus Liptonbacteria bacterium RIFCSPLOWO2_01_FULL_45_15]|uniref:Uncharacterized protein n=1 Tax=Candidatus Liptonbacteria bacterium RIFCSPLOWO2_01_FULL_45_15 TaxID=1798649 RepID=A0A1G2CI40_9BACT|nr:MAG: hypothetical protein A3B13_01170 [Candidatus Liptonbacteria bacterium RIFCSPLOWO2_01_FULL_45_15]